MRSTEVEQFFSRQVVTIQARDLRKFEREHDRLGHGNITVKIEEKWREVFEVWEDAEDAEDMYITAAEQIRKWVGWGTPCWVMVRYLAEESSEDWDLADGLKKWRLCDLVEVQVPVPLFMPPGGPYHDEPKEGASDDVQP